MNKFNLDQTRTKGFENWQRYPDQDIRSKESSKWFDEFSKKKRHVRPKVVWLVYGRTNVEWNELFNAINSNLPFNLLTWIKLCILSCTFFTKKINKTRHRQNSPVGSCWLRCSANVYVCVGKKRYSRTLWMKWMNYHNRIDLKEFCLLLSSLWFLFFCIIRRYCIILLFTL